MINKRVFMPIFIIDLTQSTEETESKKQENDESRFIRDGLERIKSDRFGWYIHDAHGDVIAMVDASGAVTKTYSYDANGNENSPISSDLNPFRYTGEYFDKDVSLYYLRARWMDPFVGEFLSIDPIKDGHNWYLYANNNPIKFIDPSGLAAGDKFETEEEAVEDMYEEYYGITDYTQCEMAASLYQGTQDGATFYSYTEPIMGDFHGVSSYNTKEDVPEGTTHIAYIHTHPGSESEAHAKLSENFSEDDSKFVNNKNVQLPLYLLTSQGNIRKWTTEHTFDTKDKHNNKGALISSGLTFKKVQGTQKHNLMMKYGPEMFLHGDECKNKDGSPGRHAKRKQTSQATRDYVDYLVEIGSPLVVVVR